MRSLALTVAPGDEEAVLDALLPLAPLGIHRRERDGGVQLTMHGEPADLPDTRTIAARCGTLVGGVAFGEAPDEWRSRRLALYEPLVIGGRIVVRPDWAPSSPPGTLEVVLSGDDAFGTGDHPTTRACLELLEAMPPGESLADLGCGSGVLAITAAKLGWRRVVAVDRSSSSVRATGENARSNGVDVIARRVDLTVTPPPRAHAVVANVPPDVHAAIAERLDERPRTLVAMGFLAESADTVVSAYASVGLALEHRADVSEWPMLVLAGAPR